MLLTLSVDKIDKIKTKLKMCKPKCNLNHLASLNSHDILDVHLCVLTDDGSQHV